eukprot:3337476-Lingulodinium_polyedra.AAC.1
MDPDICKFQAPSEPGRVGSRGTSLGGGLVGRFVVPPADRNPVRRTACGRVAAERTIQDTVQL